MSLLREIQELATDSKVKLSDVLRRAKVLAARLGNDAFKQWVERELNGYPDRKTVPDYRVIPTPNYGDFAGPFGSGLRNAPIPSQCIPDQLREIIEQYHANQGVSCYEQLINRKPADAPLQVAWDPNLIALVGQKIYERMNCFAAWQSIPEGALAAVLDTVRNKLLDFVLEIEVAAPEAGEVGAGNRPVPPEKVSQIFNTYIMGGTAVVAGLVEAVNQFQVAPGSFDDLKTQLKNLGVDDSDYRELQKAIQSDPKPTSAEKLGGGVAGWIGKMVAKAGSGAWSVSVKIAGDILSRLVCSYYGLK